MENQKPDQPPEPEQSPDNPVEKGAGVADAVDKPTAKPRKAAARKPAKKKARAKRKPVVKQPITSDDIVEGAVDLKDRAVAVVSRETNDFVGQLVTRLKDKANDFFDRLEGKKK